MFPNLANLPGRDIVSETGTNEPVCLSLHLMPSCKCKVSVPSKKDIHNIETNKKDWAKTSNCKRNDIEFIDFLSREISKNFGASTQVEESNSDDRLDGLELRIWNPRLPRRRSMGVEIVPCNQVLPMNPITFEDEILQQEDPIVMGNEIIPYVQVQTPNSIIMEEEILQHEDPILMGNEIIPYDQVQPPNPIIMDAEIIQQFQIEDEDPDHWRITKVLTKSDVDGSSRLLIGRNQVLAHIAPFFTNDPSKFCQNNEGLRFAVFDVDTRIEYMLTLKKWKTNSFVLLDKWKKHFVDRRTLEENDEVGLRWDVNASRLEFTVLRRHHNQE